MDNNAFQNSPPAIEIVGGTIEVTSHLDGRSLISGLWRTIFTGSLVQDGDYFIDRSRALLERHLKLLQPRDQNTIRQNYDAVRDMRDKMEDQSSTSLLRRNRGARKYRRRARKTYKLVENASARALHNLLRKQLAEATRPPAPGDGSGSSPGAGTVASDPFGEAGSMIPGTVASDPFGEAGSMIQGTVASDPFGDAHAISRITDINVNNVVRVDVSAYQDEATDEGAAVFDLIFRDRSVKHVIAFAGDRTDMGASQSTDSVPVPISSHQVDDSRPDIIAAPDVSDQRVDEQGETHTLNSFVLSEVVTSEGNRPHPVMRASVHPVDGDPYTPFFSIFCPS